MDRSEDLWKEQGHRGGGSPAFDRVKAVVADLLVEAAGVVHQKSAVTGHAEISDWGDRAAHWLEHSADYVREIEAQRLKSDLEDKVRRNPGRSLIIAGVIGLVIGRVIRRR